MGRGYITFLKPFFFTGCLFRRLHQHHSSDDATYMTGSEFNIDGGLLAGTVATPTVVGDTGA
jgi:hypothetical protein